MRGRTRQILSRSRLLSRFPELVHGLGIVIGGLRFGGSSGIRASRERICSRLGIRAHDLVLAEQVHENNVRIVTRAHRGAGASPGTYLSGTDGMVTPSRGVILGVYSADCVPLLAYDPKHGIVGAVHAGWRGIARGVIPSFIRALQRTGGDPRSSYFWLAPSAHVCCYALRPGQTKKMQALIRRYGTRVVRSEGNDHYLDLPKAIVHDLVTAGIPRSHIELDPTCTIHDRKRLPSHRREGERRSRSLMTIIGLRDPVANLKGRRVLVVGLGLHGGGVDTTRWLVEQGANVVVTDLRSREILRPSLERLRDLRVKYVLGRHRLSDVRHADLIVVNPDVPREAPIVQRARNLSIPIEGDAGLFFSSCRSPIVGITGTKGKTTVTILVARMLRASGVRVVTVGIDGVPFLSALKTITPSSIVVAELSSWRLEALEQHRMSPHVAVITNLMPDHLNRYLNFSEYAKAKETILRFQTSDDVAVLNRENRWTRALGREAPARRWWFSSSSFPEENGCFLRGRTAYLRAAGKLHILFKTPELHRTQHHELTNFFAAAAAAYAIGATIPAIRKTVLEFEGIAHRLEHVATIDGIHYINDSAATTPESALSGLASIHSPIIMIAGGSDKNLDYREFARALTRRCKTLILFDGSATRKLLRHLLNTPVTIVESMRRAVRLATALADAGDTVLLSPGAASFGVFNHEFDRGNQFRDAVRELRI